VWRREGGKGWRGLALSLVFRCLILGLWLKILDWVCWYLGPGGQ